MMTSHASLPLYIASGNQKLDHRRPTTPAQSKAWDIACCLKEAVMLMIPVDELKVVVI